MWVSISRIFSSPCVTDGVIIMIMISNYKSFSTSSCKTLKLTECDKMKAYKQLQDLWRRNYA